jgi:outer membrane biogenesis lipoprotein LolB
MSSGAKIGILAGCIGGAALAASVILFCCITQRRVGRKEHEALLAEEQREAAELNEYKQKMQAGKFGFGNRV